MFFYPVYAATEGPSHLQCFKSYHNMYDCLDMVLSEPFSNPHGSIFQHACIVWTVNSEATLCNLTSSFHHVFWYAPPEWNSQLLWRLQSEGKKKKHQHNASVKTNRRGRSVSWLLPTLENYICHPGAWTLFTHNHLCDKAKAVINMFTHSSSASHFLVTIAASPKS